MFYGACTELDISQVQLANADEVAKFVTKKRKDEHLSGRLLLEMALENGA